MAKLVVFQKGQFLINNTVIGFLLRLLQPREFPRAPPGARKCWHRLLAAARYQTPIKTIAFLNVGLHKREHQIKTHVFSRCPLPQTLKTHKNHCLFNSLGSTNVNIQ